MPDRRPNRSPDRVLERCEITGRPYKGGNTSAGSQRRGNRRGRPAAYAEGTLTTATNIVLSDAHLALAHVLGAGNVSAGIRRALGAFSRMLRTAPASLAEAVAHTATHKAYAVADAARAVSLIEDYAEANRELINSKPGIAPTIVKDHKKAFMVDMKTARAAVAEDIAWLDQGAENE